MVASMAARRPQTGRRLLALSPLAAAVALMVVFGLGDVGAAGSRASTNPAVAVPGLLTTADTGPGWTATHAGSIEAEAPGCFRPRAAMLASSPRSLVGVLLTRAGGLPQVDEIAARYTSSAGATAAFAAVAGTLRCATFATPGGDASVTRAPVAREGDRAAGATVSLRGGGAEFVVAQRGTGLVLVVYGTAGAPDPSASGRLVARALERLGP